MNLICKSLFFSFFLTSSLLAFGQKDINNESFNSKFISEKDGAKVIFNGKLHAFSIEIVGKNVKLQGTAGADNNQNFIDCDGIVIQTSWVPLPQPIPPAMFLSKLTDEEQTETLNGYADYELDYFKNELKLNVVNTKKEWLTLNSKLYLVWSFDTPSQKTDQNNANKVIRQIYFSTVCFNQVLDLNIPIVKMEQSQIGIELLKKVATTLKTYNNRL
jgi:hypothetical protein